jgi:branched-chain amino acid transport system permease protein
MALILGIVGIINLAHGEFMMLGAYLAYWVSTSTGIDPLIALIPVAIAMFLMGVLTYKTTINRVLAAPELNQLILTFGIAIVLGQIVNLIATSQPRKVSLPYVSASAQVGSLSFGAYDFVFVAVAIIFLVGLLLFLRKTKMGKAAVAVGQNPQGARLVGINVERTYMIIFSIAIGMLGIMGTLFLTGHSIFPLVGGPYTMKSFCLVAMAGIGNLPGILWGSIGLGIAESFIKSFKGYGGWADIVFFAIIIIVIVARSYKRTDS